MLKGALARRYAQALFEVAQQGSLDKIAEEFKEVAQIAQHEDVAHVLNHPHISASDKKAVMDKLLNQSWGETMRNFVFLLIDHRRQDVLLDIETEFSKMVDEKQQVVEVKLASAAPLSAEQEERLKETLTKRVGKKVRMIKELRPELIGGVLLQIGDQVMDGSVAHALTKMREDLHKNSGYEPQEVGVK